MSRELTPMAEYNTPLSVEYLVSFRPHSSHICHVAAGRKL
ncbi:cadherin [Acetobacter orientalis]|uniref:Cadherin n=1 Tax=Acetobacter orientalis TaxID=146474 RepID=A0A2Z5ZHX7_9PROT|nr:cadherin [Acetobacter orientalis]